jgi:hypothetical protein
MGHPEAIGLLLEMDGGLSPHDDAIQGMSIGYAVTEPMLGACLRR